MIRNTDHDATFGRSVQFGNRQSIHLGCSRKLLGLFKCVLSGRTVQYQQDFVRCIGNHFLHHILDLGQLVHQIDLVMQATGGIDNHHIRPVRLCRTQRVKCHRSRVGTHLLLHDRHSYPFAPNHQLLYSCGAERIGCSQIHIFTGLLELISQFADRGRLAYPVHAYDHDDIRLLVFRNRKRLQVFRMIFCKQGSDLFTQDRCQLTGRHIFVSGYAVFDTGYDFQCSIYSDIGSNQYFFQIVQHFVVHLAFTGNGSGNLRKYIFFCLR